MLLLHLQTGAKQRRVYKSRGAGGWTVCSTKLFPPSVILPQEVTDYKVWNNVWLRCILTARLFSETLIFLPQPESSPLGSSMRTSWKISSTYSSFPSKFSSSPPPTLETHPGICKALSPVAAAFLSFLGLILPLSSSNSSAHLSVAPTGLCIHRKPPCSPRRPTLHPSALSDHTVYMAFFFYPISHVPACLPAVGATESHSALFLPFFSFPLFSCRLHPPPAALQQK